MSRAIFVLGFTSLAFGATTLYFKDQASSEHAQVEELQARVGEIEKQRAAPPPMPPPPPEVVAESPAPFPPPPAHIAAAAQPAVAMNSMRAGFIATPFTANMRERSQKLLQDPEYREAMRMQQRATLPDQYPDLAKALHLTPEQQDKLLDVLAEQRMRQMSVAPPVRINGEQPPDEATIRQWQEQFAKVQRDNDKEIADVLGSGGAQEWKDYQSSLAARMQVRQLKSTMESNAEPLSEDQVQSLVTALTNDGQRRAVAFAANQQSVTARLDPTADRAAMFEQSLQYMEQNNKRTHDAVAPYLTPAQLASFEASQNRQMEMQRASIKMMRAQSAADARDGVQPNGMTSMGSSGTVIYQAEPPR